MAVRSKRLWGPTAVSTLPTTIYTCPASETAIIKQLTIVNNNALGNTLLLRLNSDAALNNLMSWVVAGSSSISVEGLFIVLHPGDFIRGVATSSAFVVTGSGAELEGFAD